MGATDTAVQTMFTVDNAVRIQTLHQSHLLDLYFDVRRYCQVPKSVRPHLLEFRFILNPVFVLSKCLYISRKSVVAPCTVDEIIWRNTTIDCPPTNQLWHPRSAGAAPTRRYGLLQQKLAVTFLMDYS